MRMPWATFLAVTACAVVACLYDEVREPPQDDGGDGTGAGYVGLPPHPGPPGDGPSGSCGYEVIELPQIDGPSVYVLLPLECANDVEDPSGPVTIDIPGP